MIYNIYNEYIFFLPYTLALLADKINKKKFDFLIFIFTIDFSLFFCCGFSFSEAPRVFFIEVSLHFLHCNIIGDRFKSLFFLKHCLWCFSNDFQLIF